METQKSQNCEEAAVSQIRSETRADLDHIISDQDICRQRGAEIALEQLTLPAHPSETRFSRSPGESIKLSAQKQTALQRFRACLLPLEKIHYQEELPSLLNQTLGVDFLFATIN